MRHLLTITAAEHQYYIEGADGDEDDWEEDDEAWIQPTSNGLLAVHPQRQTALVYAGTSESRIQVTVEVLDTFPEPEMTGWEEVVEVSMVLHKLVVFSTTEAQNDGDLPESLLPSSGDYRVRVSARGRDQWIPVFDSLPDDYTQTEQCLIQVWPSEPGPEIIRKQEGLLGRAYQGEEVPELAQVPYMI